MLLVNHIPNLWDGASTRTCRPLMRYLNFRFNLHRHEIFVVTRPLVKYLLNADTEFTKLQEIGTRPGQTRRDNEPNRGTQTRR